jgi:RNA polymerase sigma-70 factor (ECF subfamily)
MQKRTRQEFEDIMLPHLGASYNLALYLLRHPPDAQDAVQDSYLKAFVAFDQFSGQNSGAWLLKIVRNTCLNTLRRNQNSKVVRLGAITNHPQQERIELELPDTRPLPDEQLIAESDRIVMQNAIAQLPVDYREVLVLREFEDLNYKNIAHITGIPIGTVMSRLSRARKLLRNLLASNKDGGKESELQ